MTETPILNMAVIVATPDNERRCFQIAQRVRWAIANRSRVVYNGDDETFPVPIVTTMDALYRKFTTPQDRFGGWSLFKRQLLIDFAKTKDPKALMLQCGFAPSTVSNLSNLSLPLDATNGSNSSTPSKAVAIRVEYEDDTWSEHVIVDASRPSTWTDDDDYSR